MNFLDRLAYNRLISIILSFILAIIKIFAPKAAKELEDKYPPPIVPKFPLRKRNRKQKENN